MTSEFSVTFSGAGGHNHDGISSSRIDTTSYSIFDFRTGIIGNNPSRTSLQQTNKISFDNYIIDLLNTKEFSPTLIKIKPNSLAGKILVQGTLTTDKLETNMVLVKQQIQSDNFNGVIDSNQNITNDGTTGWAISSSGQSVFNDVTVRGTIIANSGNIGGIVISNSAIYSSDFDGSNGFALYSNGFADFNEVSVRGEILANSGNIGGILISSSAIYSSDFDGSNGFALYSNGFADFNEVSVRGEIFATSGSIDDNFQIGANLIIGNNLNIGNNVRINGAAADGATSVLKIRADAQTIPPGNSVSNVGDPGRIPLRVTSFLDNLAFSVRYDGRCDLGATSFVDGSIIQTSDIRYKKNIQNSQLGLDFIKKLKPVSFYWDNIEGNDSLNINQGFIAQDIRMIKNSFEEEFGGWFLTDENNPESKQGLDYVQFIPPVVKAIQELSERNEQLEARLQALEGV
jgi:hypothetical protein